MIPAVKEELGAVVVDLEAVVLALAEGEQDGAVTFCHVVRVRRRHPVLELKSLVAHIRHLRHRADDHAVVAAPQFNKGLHGVIVNHDQIVAGKCADGKTVHTPVADLFAGGVDTLNSLLQLLGNDFQRISSQSLITVLGTFDGDAVGVSGYYRPLQADCGKQGHGIVAYRSPAGYAIFGHGNVSGRR